MEKAAASRDDEELPSSAQALHVACRLGSVDHVLAALDAAAASVNAVNTAGETPLFIASCWGHTHVVQMLLEKGAHVELGKVNSDMTPLRTAAKNGHVDVVRALLGANARVDDVESEDGLTVLYEAARKGYVEVARVLLEHGAKLHVPNRNEQTPLYASARNGHTDVMRLLLEHGDEVDRVNTNNVTPLWIAGLKGRVEAVELLLAHGANVDAGDVSGVTPLWIAAQEGRISVVQALLKHGADANATANEGITPLSASVHSSRSAIIKELITYGAQVDAVDSNGHTPLYLVCRDGYLSAVKILLANGACVEGVTDAVDGLTPLFVAAQNGYSGIVLALLSHHASVNFRDSDGATPLHAASERGHADIIHALVVKGSADKQAADKNGETALHVAARNGHMDAVKALLKLGAHADSPNKRHETPLHIACGNGYVAVAQAMLTKGASAALSTRDGDTPLHAAARNGHADVVSKLLARDSTGLPVDAVNNRGATAFLEASGNGYLAVVDVLLNAGAQLETADEGDNTPLIAASRGGHLGTVLALLAAGASVDTTNAVGETAALAAGSSGHFELVKELVTRGGSSVHVRAAGFGGETLLTAAARWGDVGAVSFLIEHGRQHGGIEDGEQQPLLPATLQTLREYGPHMHEFQAMWESVVGRLHAIYAVFEEQQPEETPSALVDQYLMIIFRIVRMKLVWEKRNLFTRLVASRNATSAFQDFHTELDHLQRRVSATMGDGAAIATTSEWRHEWETDREDLTEQFWSLAKDDDRLLPHLIQGADVLEAILLLLYEINTHSNHCTQRKLELLEFSVKKLKTRVNPDMAIELPKWFLPHHELDFEHAAEEISQPSKPFSGKWLNSSVLIRACQLDQGPVVALADRWFPLSHPNVIKIFGVYHLREPYLVVFENAPVTSLRGYLGAKQQQSHHFSFHMVWQKLYEVALGLKYLHDRGIVLGKLQCDSIWITAGGLAKIAECGLDSRDLTASDEPLNESRWAAAECLEGYPPTPESDVYSLGTCIVEAFTGEDPWHGKPVKKVISLIRWGLSPPQPPQLSDSQWSLVSKMCSFDPLKRGKLATIVEHLKQFATVESDNDPRASVATAERHSQQQRSSHMLTALELAGRVFPELGSSINTFLVKLERKSDLCSDAREYVAHVHARLANIFAWLQEAHNVASEVAVTKFCQVLVSFDHFLSVAVSQTSVIRQAKSRKVSLSNSVLHREIDELMGFLSMEGSVDSIHSWRSSVRSSSSDKLLRSLTESESDSVKSEPGGVGAAAGDNEVVKLVQFESKHVNQKFAPVAITSAEAMDCDDTVGTPPWFIPLYDLKFKKEDCIGTGAFGEVYRGAWLSTPVVVKMMGYEDDEDDDSGCNNTQSMFLHELRVWYPLNHPHVVKLFGACHVGKRFFVCEFAANGTLRSFLARSRGDSGGGSTATPTATTGTWQALYEVALGLQYLHDLTIVHNDLKCDNFLVGADGKVKITDFGLSCIAHTTEIQVDLAKLGAQQWKAPEYLCGERSTLASDVYSLGMCILEAATGTLPWGSMADAFVRRNVRRGVLPKCPSALSARQWNLVELTCANEPTHRLRIATVVERLQEFAHQEAAAAVVTAV